MNIKHSQGLTLVEMMVAMLISLILMAGVLTIMSSSKRTYALQNELGVLQDNARFVMNDLIRSLRMAGYEGCKKDETNPAPPFEDGSINNQTIKNQNGGNISLAVPQSDRIVMQASEILDYVSTQTFNNGTSIIRLEVDNDYLPVNGDEVRIVNCSAGPEDRTINNVNNTPAAYQITLSSSLDNTYEELVDVLYQYVAQYEICQTDEIDFGLFKGTDIDGDGTICDEDENGDAMTGKELLAEGVENLQVRYGNDTDGDGIPNRYETAPDGINTKSIRVTLLMRTVEKRIDLVDATNKVFELDPDLSYNPEVDAHDIESGYRHRFFTATVGVRNSNTAFMQ